MQHVDYNFDLAQYRCRELHPNVERIYKLVSKPFGRHGRDVFIRSCCDFLVLIRQFLENLVVDIQVGKEHVPFHEKGRVHTSKDSDASMSLEKTVGSRDSWDRELVESCGESEV